MNDPTTSCPESSSPDTSVNNSYITNVRNTSGSDSVKIVAIISAVLLIGFTIFAICFRSSTISINVGANNTITNTVIEDKSTHESAPAATAAPQPTAIPEETVSEPQPGLFQRIGNWIGWLFTTWLPQAIADVLKFIFVDIIWGFLIKTIVFGVFRFLWNLIVSLWHVIFG